MPLSYKFIPLNKERFATVDLVDCDLVSTIPWRVSDSGYAICDRQPRRMHRLIMQQMLGRVLLPGEFVDHINRERLDNRRSNLRLATLSQNGANLFNSRNTTGYKGVTKRQFATKVAWYAKMKYQGVFIHIGIFATAEEAAYAYDQFAIQLYGEYANCNVLN